MAVNITKDTSQSLLGCDAM